MRRELDFSPLVDRVDSAAVRALAKSMRRDRRYDHWSTGMWIFGLVFFIIGIAFFSLFFALMAYTALSGHSDPDLSIGGQIALGFGMFIMVFIYAGLWYLFVKLIPQAHGAKTLYRLKLFAERNDLTFSPQDPNPGYRGTPFTRSVTTLQDHFTPVGAALPDYGTASGAGNATTTRMEWGYLALRLERTLPHIVLRSRRSSSGMVPLLDDDQRLSLEGDFDEYFNLYCPAGYERDALYIFTPDLMALLIDEAARFDVEIIDDWMFFYASSLDMREPEVHERMRRIAQTVGVKALDQTENYRDERMPPQTPNFVAPPGRRLKQVVSIAGIFGVILFGVTPFVLLIAAVIEENQ